MQQKESFDMKTIHTLLRKDLPRLWPFIITWLIMASISVCYLHNTHTAVLAKAIFPLPPLVMIMIPWLALTAVVSFIVHDSPPSGTTEFWMTRPISGRQLFASKFIVVFLICVLMPVLAYRILRAVMLTSETGAINIQMTLNYTEIGILIFMLCLMLIASLTQNMMQYIFAIFGIIFVISLTAFTRTTVIFSSFGKESAGQHPRHPDALKWTLIALSITGLVFLIYNQYTRRRRMVTIIFSVLLASVLHVIWRLWPLV
jgi:hypothetical protein